MANRFLRATTLSVFLSMIVSPLSAADKFVFDEQLLQGKPVVPKEVVPKEVVPKCEIGSTEPLARRLDQNAPRLGVHQHHGRILLQGGQHGQVTCQDRDQRRADDGDGQQHQARVKQIHCNL